MWRTMAGARFLQAFYCCWQRRFAFLCGSRQVEVKKGCSFVMLCYGFLLLIILLWIKWSPLLGYIRWTRVERILFRCAELIWYWTVLAYRCIHAVVMIWSHFVFSLTPVNLHIIITCPHSLAQIMEHHKNQLHGLLHPTTREQLELLTKIHTPLIPSYIVNSDVNVV